MRPTRFGGNSSLIDNIFTNKPDDTSIAGILISDISDHLPIFCLKTPILSPKPAFTNIKTRALTDANIKTFREKLALTNWFDIYTLTDAQIAYDSFLRKFNTIHNSTIPLVQKRVKCYSESNKPWISSTIQKYIHRKNSLY